MHIQVQPRGSSEPSTHVGRFALEGLWQGCSVTFDCAPCSHVLNHVSSHASELVRSGSPGFVKARLGQDLLRLDSRTGPVRSPGHALLILFLTLAACYALLLCPSAADLPLCPCCERLGSGHLYQSMSGEAAWRKMRLRLFGLEMCRAPAFGMAEEALGVLRQDAPLSTAAGSPAKGRHGITGRFIVDTRLLMSPLAPNKLVGRGH